MRGSTMFTRFLTGLPSLGLVLTIGLAGCEQPPADAYVAGGGPRGDGVLVGRNSVGDPCHQHKVGTDGGVDIYCGAWGQPAGRVRSATDTAPLGQQASSFAASLAPRITDCGPAQATTFPGADQALRMSCTRGRWTHAVLVASAAGKVYLADGMEAVVPAMQRSIGVLAGRAQPLPAQEAERRNAGRRPDPNDFQGLMLAGMAANREGFSEEAADHFRAAVAYQERATRKDAWGLYTALIALGVQLSNQGRFTEAEAVFTRASDPRLMQSSSLASAHLQHYRALHLLNVGVVRSDAGALAQSLDLMRSAEDAYLANLPPGSTGTPNSELLTRFAPTTLVSLLGQGQGFQAGSRGDLEIAMGVIETRRGQAMILRAQGQPDAALPVAVSAEDFARSRGLTLPKVAAFFYRTTGMVMLSSGQAEPSADRFELSVEAFRQGWRTTPTPKLAQTQLRRAEALLRTGDTSGTLQSCRDATQMLTTLRLSVDGELLQPCLTAYAREVAGLSDPQPVLREMFLTAQLSRASATANLAQKAALRLGADPKIASELAIRDSANAELNELRDRRAKLGSGSEAAAIDQRIAAVEADLRTTETNLQDALPNYHALLEPFATAEQVFAVLRPREAMAAINLTNNDGWVFLLRDNSIRLGRIEGGNRAMGEMVTRLRASIEPTGPRPPDYDTATAHQLYKAVFGSVAAGLDGASELSVVPVGKLLSIPFQVLLTEAYGGTNLSDAPFLVKRFAITHVPSASNLLRLRQPTTAARAAPGATVAQGTARRPWFGFGSSAQITPAVAQRLYPSGRCGEGESARRIVQLPVLPGAARELNAVRQLMQAAPSEELIGAAFTRQGTLTRTLTDYRVLHFASHALLQSDIACLEEPAIVTSIAANDPKPELLTATDILSRMKLSADVVVLSACNTGGGSGKDGGESLSGLAKSFFFAGARSLMVTHWAVDDLTNVRLVVEALDGMKDSPDGALSPALRRAQMRMLATPGYEHPFFWAPMIVLGEGGGRPTGGNTSSFRSAGL